MPIAASAIMSGPIPSNGLEGSMSSATNCSLDTDWSPGPLSGHGPDRQPLGEPPPDRTNVALTPSSDVAAVGGWSFAWRRDSATVPGMGSPVTRQGGEGDEAATSNNDGQPRISESDLYRSAVDEYRFQAQFNWSRTQYLLAFNTGILAAAAAVASRPGRSAALVFLLGTIAASLSLSVVRTQHDYYRAARDRMRRIEAAAGLTEHGIDTTSTLGGRRRLLSVNQVVYLLLSSLVVANLVGALLVLFS